MSTIKVNNIAPATGTTTHVSGNLLVTGSMQVTGNVHLSGNLTVIGTTTTVNSTTFNVTSSITFEGPQSSHETTLGVTDPTADATINLPAMSAGTYHVPVLAAASTTAISSTPAELNLLDGSGKSTSSITIADADAFIVIDGTTTKQIPASDLKTYAGGTAADDITVGDAAVSIRTTSGNITIDADAGSINVTGSTLTLSGSDNVIIRAKNSSAQNAIVLSASAGGIDMNAAGPIHMSGSTFTVSSSATTDGSDGAGSILLSASLGGIGLAWSDGKDLWAEGGRFVVVANENASEAIKLHADAGANQTIQIINDAGTADGAEGSGAIDIEATLGGISLHAADDKDIAIEAGQVVLTANHDTAQSIKLHADAGTSQTIQIINDAGTTDGSEGAGAIDIEATAGGIGLRAADDKDIWAEAGQIVLTANHNASEAIKLHADAGSSQTIQIINDAGTADGAEGSGAIDIEATLGGISLHAADDKDIAIEGGQIVLTANHDTAESIKLHADAGSSQTIQIINDAGTADGAEGSGAIDIEATVGGISLHAADDKDIAIEAGQVVLTANHNTAGAIKLHADAGAAQSIEIINDAGSAHNAIVMSASAGGIDINAAGAIHMTGSSHTVTGSGNITFDSTYGQVLFGVDDTGVDVRIFSATASEGILYDASEDELALLLTTKLKFHDVGGGEEIFASSNGHLEVNAGTTLDMTAPTTEIHASTVTTIDSPIVSVESSTSSRPRVIIKNTTNDANAGVLRFVKDKGAAGAADDNVGVIEFYGDDANQDQVLFGRIRTRVAVHTDGQEGGKMHLSVASHDGELNHGLVISDGSAEDEVDVTIGNGAASVVTVPGVLSVANDIILDDGGSLKEAGGTAAFTFDGDGHVTKIGQDSPSSGEFLKYDGSKWVSDSAGGAVSAVANGSDNRLVTFSSSDALNGEANLTFDGTSLAATLDTATFTSANSTDPLVIIKNTTNDANGPRLRFVKDKGAAGAANDIAGMIEFYADDAAQDQVLFGRIASQVSVHTNGQEGGLLALQVASHDGEINNGLVLVDGSEEDEIDVTVGNGANSLTTVAGDLTVTGADIVVGADSDGTDRTVTFGHSTLKTIMGIDDSADTFIINTDADFDGTVANNSLSIDANHKMIVGGSLRAKGYIHMTHHQYAIGSAGERWIPWYNFGDLAQGSADETIQTVAPFDGRLVRVLWRPENHQDGGACILRLYKASNGTKSPGAAGTVVESVGATFSGTNAYQSNTFNTTGSAHYSAGDVIAITVDPENTPGEVMVTCVWEYNTSGL